MIVLASQSASRKAMLDAAGVKFEAVPAKIDERSLEKSLGDASAPQIALALAEAKAREVSGQRKGELVLGSDSLVSVAGRRFDKPADKDNAAEHLRYFSGKAMDLHSAAALARDGQVIWRHAAVATLQVRDLSDEFIAEYLEQEWPEVAYCVGVFRIEALGVQLFETISGEYFTVLGMPLLAVMGALRELGEMPK